MCTIVFMLALTVCPVQFPFNVMFSTTDNTAGNVQFSCIAVQAMTIYLPVAILSYVSSMSRRR